MPSTLNSNALRRMKHSFTKKTYRCTRAGYKQCHKCGEEKGIVDFNLNPTRHDGFSPNCCKCMKAYRKQRAIINKKKLKLPRKRKSPYNKRYKFYHKPDLPSV